MLKFIYCAMAAYVAVILAVGVFRKKSLKDQLTACIVLIPLIMRVLLIR